MCLLHIAFSSTQGLPKFFGLTSRRQISCFGMRKRRQLKPQPVRKQTVAKITDAQRRPIALLACLTAVAVAGFLLTRPSQQGSSRSASKLSQQSTDKNGDKKASDQTVSSKMAPVYAAKVIATYEHDLKAFTQGLVFHDGSLFESTGLNGQSSVRRVELETGKVIQTRKLDDSDFGEGLCLTRAGGEKLVQVLWKTGKGFAYNCDTLEQAFQFSVEGDAWGLASSAGEGEEIFLSDGSSRIRVYRLNGEDFVKVREFKVYDGANEVGLLNELEVIAGELWANIWFSDFLARIDIETGRVKSWVDLQGLLKDEDVPDGHETDVLNGIAYDDATGRILVTGKLWPKLFSIEVTDNVVADNIAKAGTAFFLDREQVRYVHEHLIA